jgi:hypothetical protein
MPDLHTELYRFARMHSYVLRVRRALSFVDIGVALRNCPDATHLSTESWELHCVATLTSPAGVVRILDEMGQLAALTSPIRD